MVRVVGIEPTLLAEPDFESGASTSSTTPATCAIYRHGDDFAMKFRREGFSPSLALAAGRLISSMVSPCGR